MSGRKQTETEGKFGRLLLNLIESSEDFPLLLLDGDHKVESISPAMIRLLGLDGEDVVGKAVDHCLGQFTSPTEFHSAVRETSSGQTCKGSFALIKGNRLYPGIVFHFTPVPGDSKEKASSVLVKAENLSKEREIRDEYGEVLQLMKER